MDPPSLLDFYHSVNVSSSTFFENAFSMSQLDVRREWASLGKPVDRDAWDMTVPTVK
jgi:endothelin-converting enzyme